MFKVVVMVLVDRLRVGRVSQGAGEGAAPAVDVVGSDLRCAFGACGPQRDRKSCLSRPNGSAPG